MRPRPAARYAASFVAIPRPFSRPARNPVQHCAGRPPLAAKTPRRGNPEPTKTLWRRLLADTLQGRSRQLGSTRRRCPAALQCTPPALSASCCRPRRVAAPGDADRTNRAGVFADATPTKEFRDVMVPNAPGLRASSFFPHNTASPAGRSEAALAARLGVLPQCRSACLSTPPTPRKLG
jgi:hypothetical protein